MTIRPRGLGVDMCFAGRRLHTALMCVGTRRALELGQVSRVANHPAHRRDEGRAGQRPDAFRHLVRIEPVYLLLIVEVGNGARALGEDEAVRVECKVALDRSSVANPDLERTVVARIDLPPRAHEAPVDRRTGKQVVDFGLDAADRIFDIACHVTHHFRMKVRRSTPRSNLRPMTQVERSSPDGWRTYWRSGCSAIALLRLSR